ncbi:LAFE_0H06546g1_1 [Lachancea fermentati]|uniref:LAFE_0H06546g1_1 n=1 Tax=Lachancea fermentati TaxID=4955 RepID=A0A1G4MJS6_LACFM|nr:LAFE_0H06546g1_1 [Lachancea fermentati]
MSYRGRDKEIELPIHNKKETVNAHNIDHARKRCTRKAILWRYLTFLFSLWLCVIQYYERSVIKRTMKRCAWEKWEQWPEVTNLHRVALLADPQIMDAYSYPGRPWIVNYFTQKILDNYHNRNWRYMQYYLDPDSTFFLGDLFDGGREWDDDQWFDEYKRFHKIFPKKPNRLTVMSLPGNHDIGFGDNVVENSYKRFETYFGDTSSSWNVGNHTFVLLDTIALSDSVNSEVSSKPRTFLNNFEHTEHSYPRILLTHVPLWRNPDLQKCGKERESTKPFPIMVGTQYQTVINNVISEEVLTTIKPDLIFSGDDHDYCSISHSYTVNGVKKSANEITVKSCAMNMGISRPAIQLLSLHNPPSSSNSETYNTNICYLPDPFKPLKMYGILTVFTVGSLLWMCFYPKSFNRVIARRLPSKTTVDPALLPVSTKKFDTYSQKDRKANTYIIQVTPGLRGFLVNGGSLLLAIFMMFIYYYRQFQ